MLVRDLRRYLEQTGQPEPGSEAAVVGQLLEAALTIAGPHDDMSIEELIRRLASFPRSKSKPAARQTAQTTAADVPSIVKKLESAFYSDDGFDHAIDQISRQRNVTKAILTQVFYALFKRNRGVPKSATRAELLRLISDERHILVRNEKMGKMLGRRPVAAE